MAPALVASQKMLADYAADKAKAVLKRIPNGVYEFWDYLDHDFVSQVPVRIRCTVTVKDGAIDLDYDGTDPQLMSAFNLPTGGAAPALSDAAADAHDHQPRPPAPLNHGLLARSRRRRPRARCSIRNIRRPAACATPP